MFRSLNKLKSVLKRASDISLPDRYRGGRIEKTVDYLKLLFNDYKQVFIDVKTDAKDRPLRAVTIGSALSGLAYCAARNPDEEDFRQQLIESQNDLSTVPNTIINRNSCEHVLDLIQLQNEKLLRIQSLGLFSLLYLADYSPHCCLYSSQCKYLKPKFYSYYEKVIDIGFFGKFRVLENKMIDYDINDNEWT